MQHVHHTMPVIRKNRLTRQYEQQDNKGQERDNGRDQTVDL
jgi:hypothetical protein